MPPLPPGGSDGIDALIVRIVAALAEGDPERAGALLEAAVATLGPEEAGRRILARALAAEAEAAAAGFVWRRGLRGGAAILDWCHASVAPDRRRGVLRALYAQPGPAALAGALASLDHGVRNALLNRLLGPPGDEQGAVVAQGLLYVTAYDRAFIEALVAALLRAGWTAGAVVRLALAAPPAVCTALGPPVVGAVGTGADEIRAIVSYLEKRAPELIERYARLLLEAQLLGWDRADELLRLATSIGGTAAERRDRAARLYGAILAGVTAVARERDELPELAHAVAAWLRDAPDTPVSPGPGDPVAGPAGRQVSLGSYLLAAGLRRTAAAAFVDPARDAQLVRALVDGLYDAASDVADAVVAEMMRVPGVFLLLFPALVLRAAAIPMRFVTWSGQPIESISERFPDRALKIEKLDPPGNGLRYMIFSDLHRDAPADVVDPRLWDVSHFSANGEMYLRILEWCDGEGYTVIENGDCEELWYAPTIVRRQSVDQRAQDILSLHSTVYAKLASLHAAGRYYRTRGNHDSWWLEGDPSRTAALDAAFGGSLPIHDALVIPDVKTMEEDYLRLAWDFANAFPGTPTTQQVIDFLLERIPLGLSPDRYTMHKPLFVLHGHQFDFWNCDEHNFLGKAVTNGLGVPADGLDSLPDYLKGIDLWGNPVVKFADVIAERTGEPNWPSEDLARRMARAWEFTEETERRLVDSPVYCETLAALATFLLRGDGGKPPQVQIAIGHTHRPDSRPYLNASALRGVPEAVKSAVENVKVNYYNSGTSSWWEGIIWATEILETGQARLVYWDRQSCEPQPMSWELHAPKIDWQADIGEIGALLRRLAAAADAAVQSVTTTLGQAATVAPAAAAFAEPSQLDAGCVLRYRLGAIPAALRAEAARFALLSVLARDRAPAGSAIEIELSPGDVLVGGPPGLLPCPPVPPGIGLGPLLARWLTWTATAESPSRDAGGVLLMAAYVFGAPLLATLGLALLAASESPGVHAAVEVDPTTGRVSIELRF
jgi:hypothetical protein